MLELYYLILMAWIVLIGIWVFQTFMKNKDGKFSKFVVKKQESSWNRLSIFEIFWMNGDVK